MNSEAVLESIEANLESITISTSTKTSGATELCVMWPKYCQTIDSLLYLFNSDVFFILNQC